MFSSFFSPQSNDDARFSATYAAYSDAVFGKKGVSKGNKILLPPSALEKLARMNVTWPMLFELSNPEANRKTHCGVLEFVADEGSCCLPGWMMQNLLLEESSHVEVKNVALPKGTYVKLKPVTQDFLEVTNPKAVLENSLRHFATLTEGDNIVIEYNHTTYEIEVVETKPEAAVSIIETDMQVDFDTPSYAIPESTASSKSRKNGRSAYSDKKLSSSSSSSSSSSKGSKSKKRSSKAGLGGSEETDDKEVEERPWILRIPGGVRTSCAEYDELRRSGRIPGLIGKTNAPARPDNNGGPAGGSNFVLFGGKGHVAG